MKKFFALLFAAVLGVSLTACGSGSTENQAELEKYRKYSALIDALEAEDYSRAYDELDKFCQVDAAAPDAADTGTEEQIEVIEITMDNWQDYFDVVEEERVDENAFGEAEDIYTVYTLVLKDGYEMVESDTNIVVESIYTLEWHYAEVDTVSRTLTIGDPVPNRDPEEQDDIRTLTGTENQLSSCYRSHENSAGVNMQTIATNFELVRIQGTLCLRK